MSNTDRLSPVLIATISFIVVVIILWAWYGLDNGMSYETTLVFPSQLAAHQGLAALLDAFIYHGDPLRKFTSVFYHTSYLLSMMFAREGDFIFYQIVWALLWCARGLLVVLICRRLFSAPPAISYLTGLFAVLHASDHALNWVGQLNQFGFIFWMLCAFYSYLRAITESPLSSRQVLWALAAALFVYLNLWSYESGLFITAAFPILAATVLGKRQFSANRTAAPFALFMLPIVIFVGQNFVRYFSSHEQTYQAGIMRTDTNLSALAGDLLFNVRHSLEFWTWSDGIPLHADMNAILAMQAMLVVVIAVSVASTVILSPKTSESPQSDAWRTIVLMGAFGLVLVVLSFPAYIVLQGARSLWRTQFLSGVGFAFSLGAVALALHVALRANVLRWVAPAFLAIIVGMYAVYSSTELAAAHFNVWEKHKHIIGAILRAVPTVEPGTVIVLTGLPHSVDGFGHNMWYDVALRLAYPGTPVGGVYAFEEGNPAEGANLVPDAGQIRLTDIGFPSEIHAAPAKSLIVLRWQGDDSARILAAAELPAPWSSLVNAYDPKGRIACFEPNAIAWRRYMRNSWRDPDARITVPCSVTTHSSESH